MGTDVVDEAVLTVKAVQPVPWVEVHCHGGREVVRLLQDALTAQDIRACSWQEFESLTEPDPLRVAAGHALANALTVRTAAILLDQYQGALGKAFEAIRIALERGETAKASWLLANLHRQANVGRHLVTPWRVVVAGAANVGKSSLVNALAGHQRCVVAPTPGTTRDVVTTIIAVDGWPVELADTAGLRESGADLEEQGMDRARRAAAAADLCLWVVDASHPPVWPNEATDRLRLIINKVDLPSVWDLDQSPDAIRVSARTGQGLDVLCHALAQWLVPEPPEAGAAVPFTPRLCDQVEEALRHCSAN
jgi:tRNA modification GTPase